MSFKDLRVSEDVIENLSYMDITEPTEVQKKSIPKVLDNQDVLVESETGSGKTLAFGLPMIQKISGSKVQSLILTPTRELAKQVEDEISDAAPNKIETVTIYGGVDYKPQVEGAKQANIVVGTPGRILDLLKQEKLETSKLDYFVLDEADRMLDMGFQDELEQIIGFLPEDRQNLLFGATIPRELKQMCDRYDIKPETIRIKQTEHTRNLDAKYMNVNQDEKLSTLYTLLEKRDRDLSIVFCQTKNTTRWLADKLRKNSIDAQEMNGDMSQSQREKTLENFEKAEFKVIVATDVAARGIDVDRVTHVFNYDVPDKADTYTHRIGRAGRQGRKGEAITLLEKSDHQKFRKIKSKLDIPRANENLKLEDARM